MAKKSGDSAGAEDLLGDKSGGDDLLAGDAAAAKKTPKKKAPAKPAAKKAAGKTAAKPAAAPKKAAKAPAAAKSARGEGQFYFDPDEKAKLAAKIATNKKGLTTKEAAEKYEVETFKARLAMVHAVNVLEKGSIEKTGSVMTWNP